MKKLKDGWRLGKVGDLLFGLESGVSVNGEDKPFSYSDKCVLKVSAVSYGKFDENAAKVIEKKELFRAKINPKAGQIIISRSNTEELVGASAYIEKDYPNLFLPDKLWQTISKPNVNMKWLSYVLASSQVRYTLSKLATGTSSSMKNITQSELLSLKIMIPPLNEQTQIAETLSTWDNAIQTTEKLLENSRQQKKALMQRLLKGNNWLQADLAELAVISKGSQLNKNTLSDNGQYAVINGGIEPSGYTDKFNTESNTITISEGGNSCGYIGFQKEKFWCGGHCYALSNLRINCLFLYQLLKYNEENIMRLRVGSGLPNIQKKALESFSLSYPQDISEQQKIAEILSTADQEIETLQRKLECLKLEKGALMQRFLDHQE